MNALADFSLKFGSQPRELKIGQSFFNDADTVFHTIRYDFVPASIDPNKTSAIEFGENGKVTITMPNVEGSGTTESVYQGQRKPHQKECVLIINNETGDMILERLNQSMIVKKARLRQEDLTGKSLALNKVPVTTITNGNGSHGSANSSSSSATSSALLSHPGKAIIGSNCNSEKKPSSSLVSHKTGQTSNNSAKKLSPSLSNGNSLSSLTISRPNGLGKSSSHISPPSMPVFSNSNSSNKNKSGGSSSSNSIAESNSDGWKLKLPDKPPRNSTHSTAAASNCLSELSSNESSDSEAESSSDHSSDNEEYPLQAAAGSKGKNSGVPSMANGSAPRSNLIAPPPPTTVPPSMPSFVAQLSSVGGGTTDDLPAEDSGKKPSSLGLSEDSDDSSSDEEQDNGLSPFKKSQQPKQHNGTMPTVAASTAADPKPSMPKFSQLSQDLQLSESDESDD